jgi:cyanophycinase-like exopeptidase
MADAGAVPAGDSQRCQVLAIMGSGETSPTMVTIHKALVGRLGTGAHSAVLLDTPYAFQENRDDISARAQGYFARSVGLKVEVLAESRAGAIDAATVRSCDWVFAGPGSPSYALSRWRGGPVAEALRDRLAGGTGITVIASAAAAAIGLLALPVYEIYKVGAEPHWLEGLDLLSVLGLKVAVIPHYDNAEGGTHDTRFCYLGERRLAMLERQMPPDSAVLGVDEHTALIIDLARQRAEVAGRGSATVRKAGQSTVLSSGSVMTLADLATLVRSGPPALSAGQAADLGGADLAAEPAGVGAHDNRPPLAPSADLLDLSRTAADRFAAAADSRCGSEMAEAILDLEAAIQDWSTDTDENDNADRARAVLRGLVTRLGQAAQQGLADPAAQLRPSIDPLLKLREDLRQSGSYEHADLIRDALAAAGIEVRDTPDGSDWTVSGER